MINHRGPFLVLFLLCIGIFTTLTLIAFFVRAPVLCASFIGLFYVVGLYLTTAESKYKWRWHDAQEFENRFWTVTGFLFATAVLYAKDSPFAIGLYSSSLGLIGVVSFTLLVQYYDRALHRVEISRKPRIKNEVSKSVKVFQYRATASEKTKVLQQCLEMIDRVYFPSTINNMIHLTHVKRQERRIFRILAGSSKDELNFMVNKMQLALLIYKVKDHYGGDTELYRTMILDLLCKKRLADLSVMARAILLDALMVMKLSAHKDSEKFVKNIILCTTGDELSKVRNRRVFHISLTWCS